MTSTDAAIVVAVPLQVQALSPSERRSLASIKTLNQIVSGNVEVLNQLIGSDIADVAGLVAADLGAIGRFITVVVSRRLGFDATGCGTSNRRDRDGSCQPA